jgi:hypothetical protein
MLYYNEANYSGPYPETKETGYSWKKAYGAGCLTKLPGSLVSS